MFEVLQIFLLGDIDRLEAQLGPSLWVAEME